MSVAIEKAWQLGKHVGVLVDEGRFEERDEANRGLGEILSPFTIGTEIRQDIIDAYWEGYWGEPLPEQKEEKTKKPPKMQGIRTTLSITDESTGGE